MSGVLIARSRTIACASERRRPPTMKGSQGLKTSEPKLARPTLNATLLVRTSPSARRSSGTKPIPALTASEQSRGSKVAPSRVIVPLSGRSAPKTSRASSLRPAPTRPPRPSTSPRRRSKLTSLTLGARVRPRTESTVFPGPADARPTTRSAVCSRPMIASTRARLFKAPPASSATERPSRNTETRWQRSSTSSSRCET